MSSPKKKLECVGDPDIEIFNEYKAEGKTPNIIGIDEAGRGPIAGPMFVGMASFQQVADCEHLGLKDSKRFSSDDKRRKVERKIRDIAWGHNVIKIPAAEIDAAININDLFDKYVADDDRIITLARCTSLTVRILVDGNRKIKGVPADIQICRPKLDATSWHVAAASILAKTAQIRYMDKLHIKYPHYGFNKHHGYGTKDHFAAIKKYGLLNEHRKSWIKPEKIS